MVPRHTFDPGTAFNDSVYALALQPSGGQIFVGGGFSDWAGRVMTVSRW